VFDFSHDFNHDFLHSGTPLLDMFPKQASSTGILFIDLLDFGTLLY